MARPIEDYALIGDTMTAALVSRIGSIDWFCAPRFDSPACFAALLGSEQAGNWSIAPTGGIRRIERRYRSGTLVLETDFETESGRVQVIDFMPIRRQTVDIVRVVKGLDGSVPMRSTLDCRFDYGRSTPWYRRLDRTLHAVAGPDAVLLRTDLWRTYEPAPVVDFEVRAGDEIGFLLAWYPSYRPIAPTIDPRAALDETTRWWRRWSARCSYHGVYADAVVRSLVTLKALTYRPSGGIIAAATTSLPEEMGGSRNWDYRYCWLRDATFTLLALMKAGYTEEAADFREWLLRAVAGEPTEVQIMYGPAGERRLPEMELPWLDGYEGSRPVRIGNAAVDELQLDVFGEVMDALYQARTLHVGPSPDAWRLQVDLMQTLEANWSRPDQGIWEVRGSHRHFTHSKVMAWVAVDRGVKSLELGGLEGPLQHWRTLRDHIHADVCSHGFNPDRGAFVQSYGSRELDASLLMIPLVGFLPIDDPRVQGTIACIERELIEGGLVRRYAGHNSDGLPGRDATFLACSFWLADCYRLSGRRDDAVRLFERLLALRNDVGLLSEEYDPVAGRMLGNFPQAFSHVGIINTALNLDTVGPAQERSHEEQRSEPAATTW